MNIKKPSMGTPLNYGDKQTTNVSAQNEFKSLPSKTSVTPGKNGVILHVAGCSGNHLGKC